MESPVKKLDFNPSDKENKPLDDDSLATLEAQIDAKHSESTPLDAPKEENKPAVAPTIKDEEADEPLLQENPQRFVLFPIKYHEVRDAFAPPRVKWFPSSHTINSDNVGIDLADVQEGRGLLLDCRRD